mmetsp:Transcript_83426/g.157061  ORF Transcript_83426/g.157061 Transcript_83426/m.157061 type:complete len:91 (-) Transcript_83426:37-309(-)
MAANIVTPGSTHQAAPLEDVASVAEDSLHATQIEWETSELSELRGAGRISLVNLLSGSGSPRSVAAFQIDPLLPRLLAADYSLWLLGQSS